MRGKVDLYGVLGVSRDVTREELKRRYRQLVRQYHPDVAADPEAAHERFIAIVEAYQTLSDPVRRRAYDALQASSPPPPQTRSDQIQRQIDDWFRHAIHRFEQGDLNGAAAQCRKILALDPRHGAAHALLGDVYAQRQEWDQALAAYSSAVAAAPRNAVYAGKLREAAEQGQRARQAVERRERMAEQRRRAIEALNARHELMPYASIVLLAWLVLLLAWSYAAPGAPPFDGFPLPTRLALAALGAGLLTGLVLGLLRLPRVPDEPAPAGHQARTVAFALGLLSLGSFYLSAAAYCVLAVVRARLTPGLAAAFGAAVLCVAMLAGLTLLAPNEARELVKPMLLWSGNLVFPMTLVGAAVGRAGLRVVA